MKDKHIEVCTPEHGAYFHICLLEPFGLSTIINPISLRKTLHIYSIILQFY